MEGPYRVLEVKNIKAEVWKAGIRLMVNVNQVRIYRLRKCDEMQIRTGSSDSKGLCDGSSSFDRVQGRSSELQYGRKKGSDVKRELEEKGLSFKNEQGVRHANKTNKRGPLISSIPSSWSEKSRRIKRIKDKILRYKRSREYESSGPERKIRKGSISKRNKRNFSSNDSNVLPICSKKRRTQEKLAVSVNKYNLRPTGGREVESRSAMETKAQQRGPS
ncbi:uncharacterized protein TNCV_3774541 [Trichonephila clavipes]|nr:uncharacterized protein TNCV_3774541 [Trichonephila clavipes]